MYPFSVGCRRLFLHLLLRIGVSHQMTYSWFILIGTMRYLLYSCGILQSEQQWVHWSQFSTRRGMRSCHQLRGPCGMACFHPLFHPCIWWGWISFNIKSKDTVAVTVLSWPTKNASGVHVVLFTIGTTLWFFVEAWGTDKYIPSGDQLKSYYNSLLESPVLPKCWCGIKILRQISDLHTLWRLLNLPYPQSVIIWLPS